MRELRGGLFFFGLSILILWESFRVELGTLKEPGSGFLSFCAGLGILGLSIAVIARGWKGREPGKPHSHRVTLALVTMFVYSLVLDFLGFLLATFFLVGILFRLGQRRSWPFLIGVSALVTVVSYLIFGVFLRVYFPRGLLGI
jgi:putative tricarboxylic transport membrane protein